LLEWPLYPRNLPSKTHRAKGRVRVGKEHSIVDF
jgi:hypothetical protein